MEQKLKRLFDYQRFQKNSRLEAMLAEAEERYAGGLTDEALELVSAAGEATVPTMNPEILLGRHSIPEDVQERRL